MGKNNASEITTLIGRTSRLMILADLPYDHCVNRLAYGLTAAMNQFVRAAKTLPNMGPGPGENQQAKFTPITGILIFSCDPHSPWRRDTN